PKEKIIEKIEKLAEYGFLIYNKDKIPNIKVNPCFLASLVTYFSKLQGSELSVTQLYYYFVYSLLFTSALSESQMQLLKELSKYQEIKDPVALIEFLKRERSSPQKLKNYNYRVLEALAKILENKSSILKRRSILLDQYLAECLKINCIKQKNGLIELNNQIMKRLNTDEIVYYFNLSVKSDRYDSYVLYLLDTYRIRRVATEFRKLRDITPIDNDKKRKLLEQYLFEKNDDDIHLFAEVALYAYNIPANEMLNRVEGFRAGTRFYAFLRGSEELSSEQRKRFLEEMTKEMQKEPLKDIKTISNDILSRRREQIRRNVTVNPLEERIQQKLIEKRIIFFGGTSKQADVYLMSFLNEIGLKVIDAPEARGEDFVIPLKSGGVVAIVCRASPISFEAQRMMGHSLQFVLGWDSNREEFYLKPHLHHIAIVGGGRWDKKWVSILYSLFDRVYSGNEIDCMMDYLISLEPITFDNWPNSDYNTVLEKLRKRITGKIIDVRDLPKIIEDLKKEDLKKQAKIADFL
ncbi:MAG: hypothetical protein H5T50_05425, partial [Nitrososphaeria archaeon]|nr:hypothetical protein [Nitrososphaeria archaeon]